MDAVEILPEEVWESIIGLVEDFEDKLSVYNTCKLWRKFLSVNHVEWMLHGIFPSFARCLETSDILNCRKVCKTWNNVVNSHLQTDRPLFHKKQHERENTFDLKPWRIPEVNIYRKASRLGITEMETLQRFQTEFNPADLSTVKNPFVSRSLYLRMEELDWTALKFFKTFGVHLDCLRFCIYVRDYGDITFSIQIVKFVWQLLKLVPNIKRLRLETWHHMEYPSGWRGITHWFARKRGIKLFLRRNPLPLLSQLKCLEMKGNLYMMESVLERAYGSQRTEHVHRSQYESLSTSIIEITELAWPLVLDDAQGDGLGPFISLRYPNLKKLLLKVVPSLFEAVKRTYHSQTQQLFRIFELFLNSLTHLYIIWTHIQPIFPAKLNLPLLQELSLDIVACRNHEALNVSFLQDLKSLRTLKFIFHKCSVEHQIINRRIRHRFFPATELGDVILHLNDKDDTGPYKSNIWRLLPSLDTITIVKSDNIIEFWSETETNTYTRLEMTSLMVVSFAAIFVIKNKVGYAEIE